MRGAGVWWLWLFPVIGVSLMIGAGVMAGRTLTFLRGATPGVAQLVGYDESRGSKGGTLYDPRLRLIEPPLGHERKTGVSSSERKWKVGTKLKVKYDPDDPRRFKVDSLDDALAGPMTAGGAGLVFLVIGSMFLFLTSGPRDEVIWEPENDLFVEELVELGPEPTAGG